MERHWEGEEAPAAAPAARRPAAPAARVVHRPAAPAAHRPAHRPAGEEAVERRWEAAVAFASSLWNPEAGPEAEAVAPTRPDLDDGVESICLSVACEQLLPWCMCLAVFWLSGSRECSNRLYRLWNNEKEWVWSTWRAWRQALDRADGGRHR